jgi:hypothetical protein
MALNFPQEERAWRKFGKLLRDFPWLFAIKNNWTFRSDGERSDDVQITKNVTDLRLLLLSPAREGEVGLWVYGETECIYPESKWAIAIPHSGGKTIWAKQIDETVDSYSVLYVLVKFPHDANYTIYRDKNMGRWIKHLSRTHENTP